MTIKFTHDEVERLILIGLHNSDILSAFEGTPVVSVYYGSPGGVYCEVEVGFDKDQAPEAPESVGGAN